MTTALVTGHTGFVGRHLTRYLTNELGYRVHGFSRSDFRHIPVPAEPLVDGDDDTCLIWGTGHRGDVRRYEEVRNVVERVNPDLIFHLAAQAYVPEAGTDPHRGLAVNTSGTLNLLEAVRHTGSRARILLAGTSEEYGYEGHNDWVLDERAPCKPTTVYGVSKLAAGQLGLVYARTYGMPVVVTRAWNHTGASHADTYAISGFAKRIALIEKGKLPSLKHGNLDAVRCYLDVRDVVRAYAMAIECDPGVYNVWAPNVHPMGEFLGRLIDLSSVDIPLSPDPALYRPGMQQGSTTFPEGSADKLNAHTGWKPDHTLRDTLKSVLTYWRERV